MWESVPMDLWRSVQGTLFPFYRSPAPRGYDAGSVFHRDQVGDFEWNLPSVILSIQAGCYSPAFRTTRDCNTKFL